MNKTRFAMKRHEDRLKNEEKQSQLNKRKSRILFSKRQKNNHIKKELRKKQNKKK